MSDVTRILQSIEGGDPTAAEELLPLVYDELRRLAAAKMAQENPGQTLSATSLVHEAYLRMVDVQQAQHWDSRGHYFTAAAEAMRRILVENARRKQSLKRGGDWKQIDLGDAAVAGKESSIDLIALDEALAELEQHDEQAAQVVKLRFFAGLSHQDAATAMAISRRSADRLWTIARTWLFRRLSES